MRFRPISVTATRSVPARLTRQPRRRQCTQRSVTPRQRSVTPRRARRAVHPDLAGLRARPGFPVAHLATREARPATAPRRARAALRRARAALRRARAAPRPATAEPRPATAEPRPDTLEVRPATA